VLSVSAGELDDLDKSPVGIHQGQMMLGGFLSIGILKGNLIDSENNFLDGNLYTFSESETTKKLLVTHQAFSFGFSFEYIPINYVGIKAILARSIFIQKTIFGPQYENWVASLYKNYSLSLGPSFHISKRKIWDVSLTPLIGYSIGEYQATPIALELIDDYNEDTKQNVYSFIYGSELNFSLFFSSGLYISLGMSWVMNKLEFSKSYDLSVSNNNYSIDSGTLTTYNLVFSAGYAFSHE
jgi:hypothetical protein